MVNIKVNIEQNINMSDRELMITKPLSDRPLRLRKAILSKTAGCTHTDPVKSHDVQGVWPLLAPSGLLNRDIVNLANGNNIPVELFDNLMKLLRSNL
ncbi:hypothetical protein [Aeromonas veronii]|uniref:hypothetical protein n=1 Tax=Aeromonas veronii TaxID=654 RepID=UPI00211D8431|nr:hypothetical protein [Aeromonas veronii]UUM70740.1 hypothetical protein NQU90_09905 [Aeromonas veronii]